MFKSAIPALTIFLPTANSNAPTTISHTKANLQCLRADRVSPGSKTVPAAPDPTPLYGNKLSGVAIAGIVIGVLAGVALIAGLAFFFWRKRRRNQKTQAFSAGEKNGNLSPADTGEQQDPLEAADDRKHSVEAPDTHLKEMSPDTEVARSGTVMRPAELETLHRPVEKEAGVQAAELSADAPRRSSQ